MLEKLILRNFQNHTRKEIEFDPGVTTIVGASDEGKTAILRGLRFVCLNQPNGVGFVKDDHRSASVIVYVDGTSVSRKRGKGVNSYFLGKKKYKSFRTKVPAEIERLINVGEVNFQNQITLPYWFTESPGKVAKNLNQIINLQIIDQTVAKVSQQLRSAKAQLQATEDRLAEAKENKKNLSFVPELVKEYQKLKRLKKHHERIALESSGLRSLTRVGLEHSGTIQSALHAIVDGTNAIAVGERVQKMRRERKCLSVLVDQISDLESHVCVPDPDLTPILEVRSIGDKVAESRRNLEMLVNDFNKEQKEYTLVCSQLESLEKALHKKTKGKCPVCGKRL